MADKKLLKLLEQLHAEIERTKQVDDKGKELLRDLDGHIRELLSRSGDAPIQPQPTLARGLEVSIKHFELTHPTLTMALSDLLTALNNAGI